MSALRRLAVVTTLATYLLISVGALVRASGAGLGCPDWPKCFGRWIPPTSAEQVPLEQRDEFNAVKCWTEYANRLVGVVIGFLILATTVAAWRLAAPRRGSGVVASVTAALLLVVFQGWLGGQVVQHELDPQVVTIHFMVAVWIVWLLAYACVQSWSERLPVEEAPAASTSLRRATMVALVGATAQMLLGTLVRGGVDLAAMEDPDGARTDWLATVGWTDHTHRLAALGVMGLVFWSAWKVRRSGDAGSMLRKVSAFNVVVVSAQILAGLTLAYAGLPPVAQVVHVSLGTWIVGGLQLQWLLAGRGERRVLLGDQACQEQPA